MIPNILKFRDRHISTTSIMTLVPSHSNESIKSRDTITTTISNDYNENLNSIRNLKQFDEIITNTLLDETTNKLNLLNLNNNSNINYEKLKEFNEEIQQLRHIDSVITLPDCEIQTIDETLYKNLTLIQRDIMPIWNDININEKQSIHTLLKRWQDVIKSKFDRIKSKQKTIKPFILNENKYQQKGEFNYDQHRMNLKKLQIDLFKSLGGKSESNKSSLNTKPNTRLILRAYKKFEHTINSLENASKYELINKQLYWSNLKLFLQHLSKSILRCSIYVYENAHLYKCSLGSPPLYIIESDHFDDFDRDIPCIKFETLYEYIYLCLSQLDTGNKEDRRKHGHNVNISETNISSHNNNNNSKKNYILMLNCLIRLIQLAIFIRDCLTMKQIVYSTNIYSHYVEHEYKLYREYLKEILKKE